MKTARGKILIFGGTTEGRKAAEKLLGEGVPCVVSVATHYGEEVLKPHPLMTVHAGRLDRGGMAQMMREGLFSCVIDATHPHAQIVSREIAAACKETGLPYLRLQREGMTVDSELSEISPETADYMSPVKASNLSEITAQPDLCEAAGSSKAETEAVQADSKVFSNSAETAAGAAAQADSQVSSGAAEASGTGNNKNHTSFEHGCTFVRDIDEAGAFFASVPGRILVTTGSKELVRFAKALGDPSRITARVLPAQESLRACTEAGLVGKQIFAMQGPFDTEMNCALIRHAGASWLLTKESGATGGYPEKIEAARQCGIRAVVIRTPSAAGNDRAADRQNQNGLADKTGSDKNIEKNKMTAGECTNSMKKDSSKEMDADSAQVIKKGLLQQLNLEEAVAAALQYAGVRGKRTLSLIGIGMGAPESGTKEAQEAIAEAEMIFGAGSVLKNLLKTWDSAKGKRNVPIYESGAILQYLEQHPQIRNAAAVYSGDSGFYSGASSMLAKLKSVQSEKDSGQDSAEVSPEGSAEKLSKEVLKENPVKEAFGKPEGKTEKESPEGSAEKPSKEGLKESAENLMKAQEPGDRKESDSVRNLEVRVICGISSVSWFAARAGIPWQGWKILSSHGRFCNVVGEVRRNPECFLLLSGAEDLRRTGAILADAQERGMLGALRLIYGYELSRPAEEIKSCNAGELAQITKEGLYVLYIANENAGDAAILPGMPDSAFIRGKAPMTSSEIRALSLCRLGLTSRAVIWDVGAGTGSVSVEAALACPAGMVWSIEYKKDALKLLAENRAKFCLQNMKIVEGRAPEALADLSAPTHVFIGGSGGEIGEILSIVFAKNEDARVVVNCITSETLAALQSALKQLEVRDLQCTQVIVNREEMLGRYHYLRAGNPVFIISFRG